MGTSATVIFERVGNYFVTIVGNTVVWVDSDNNEGEFKKLDAPTGPRSLEDLQASAGFQLDLRTAISDNGTTSEWLLLYDSSTNHGLLIDIDSPQDSFWGDVKPESNIPT